MAKSQKSWQSRMQQAQDELAINFVESISIDHRLYQYDIAGSIAHAQMLQEQKIISHEDLRQIKSGLNQIADSITAGKFKFDKKYEDIHMVIEAALIKKIGEPGKKLHTGRSRNDQVCLDMRLWTRDQIDIVIEKISNLQKTLVLLAQIQGQIVMPGYTHLQRAQPILAGSHILVLAEQLQRDKERFIDARVRVNVCPLGSGALAGCSLDLNRQRVAELLGFPQITRNSIDSISDRDFCAEFLYGCCMIAMHLSRWAEDWILYCSQEFNFIQLDDAYCTGSSMMPQKKNPDMLELIRGKCGEHYGHLISLLTMLKGQPLAYNRDMQEDKKQVFASSDTIEACLDMATAIVSHTRFKPKEIASNLDKGFLDATALAEYLVKKKVPFRQAHQAVGQLVNQCESEGITLSQLPLEGFQKACPQVDKDVYDYLSAKHVVDRYQTEGSAGKKQLESQLNYWHELLD